MLVNYKRYALVYLAVTFVVVCLASYAGYINVCRCQSLSKICSGRHLLPPLVAITEGLCNMRPADAIRLAEIG